ncbi:hypothetical protein KI387_009311 [Taxus chinensis]|uniref:Uncharacterized protein n=1 Tax=Taxus chinensis TaxID=29808 RepID=A0AA38CSF6_TAXCH|nr:hypothetical protein KI387_009311 [Taxus chinensis]
MQLMVVPLMELFVAHGIDCEFWQYYNYNSKTVLKLQNSSESCPPSVEDRDPPPKLRMETNIYGKDSVTVDEKVDWKGRPARRGKHGGFRAAIFVYASYGFETMAFTGNALNLVTYFHGVMHYNLADSATTLTNFVGAAYLLSVFGAILSDTYTGRFKAGAIFGCIELTGFAVLTFQAHNGYLKPSPCNIFNPDSVCKRVRGGKAALLFFALYLISIGSGGFRAALLAHGADQFDERHSKERLQMSSYFNWILFSANSGSLIAAMTIVWIENNKGWDAGFGVSTAVVFLAVLSLVLGVTRYRLQIPTSSPLIQIVQVFVAAFFKRKTSLPQTESVLYEVHDEDKERIPHTKQFRFLDKAAIVLPSDIDSGGQVNRWRLCTVTQVEEAKFLIRMVPILSSAIVMNTCLAQLQTFSVQQGVTMDTNLGNNFKIPPASLAVVTVPFMLLLTPIYDKIFVPFARKITGHPTGITKLQRIGVGLILCSLSMAVAGMVELKRKHVAKSHKLLDAISVSQPLPISVFWLGFQYLIFGVSDIFAYVGLAEFFYSEAPSGMKTISTAFSMWSFSLGYFLSSVLVKAVNAATRNFTASRGWLGGNNLNRNHLELFYWFLSLTCVLNFLNYLYWAKWYKYKAEMTQRGVVLNAREGLKI